MQSSVEKLELNKNIRIYKLKYDWSISKNNILEKVIKNCVPQMSQSTPLCKTYQIAVKCEEFNEIAKIGIDICKSLTNLTDDYYVNHNFIYLQTLGIKHTNIQEYHTHTSHTFPNNKSILNDWTYCFYLQMPKNLKDNEGKLSFKDKDNNVVYYLPEEGDFIIFDANLEHCAQATNNTECDRITIVGTISFNITEKLKLNNKSII
jgi:hypothetical protein